MNWKQRLFKPKWQHKSADIRLESVNTEQNPGLINSLLEIAGNDEDKRVRCAAIKRLHQLENILKLYDAEKDREVIELLQDRIRQLAASSDETRPPLQFRMQVIKTTSDRDLIEHLARHAPEAELRRAALAKVERQGVLGDCCIQDSDAENRAYAASRISKHASLKRVIDALRKRDKKLYSQLQARLQQELLDAADPKAIQAEALRICTSLEHLILETNKAGSAETQALHTAWKKIAADTSTGMTERYQRICDRLAAPPVVKQPPVPQTPAPVIPEKPAIKEEPAEITEAPVDSDSIQKKAAKLELQRQQSEKELGQAQEFLAQLATQLEDGELHNALETRAALQKLAKGHGKNKDWQTINRELAAKQARLRELREWQHWSNNKVRKRLIAEMEVLPAANLHPDALLDRIKSLQMEWKALEQSEQIPADKHFASAPWMWRKFSTAGHTAFDAAKPYLDKRSEIQSRHAQSLATFCAELNQLAQAEPKDWTALSKGMNRGRKKLHDLNNIPARQRQKLARKLKTALDKANAVMQEHYQEVEREKMKLIRAASQLIHMPERSEAIDQAKSLQSNWKAAGSLWRSREQDLWNQFREHLDPLFEELKEQQDNLRAATEQNLSAQKALCTEMEELLKAGLDLSAQHGKVQGLKDSWKDIERADRRLLQSFQNLLTDYQNQVTQAELKQAEADRERRWLKSALLHELTVTGRTKKGILSKKTETRVSKAWPDESSDDSYEQAMDRAATELLGGKADTPGTDEIDDLKNQARMLTIQLEFVAGLPSPDEDRDQRMQYQVDRLAASMSGASEKQPATDEARDAEISWLGMYTLPEPEFEAFGKRIKQAMSAIMER